jgi:U3 small nucleolar RNA-associated protein 23
MGLRTKKTYKKLMHQYALNFQFREPYQCLVDAAIVQDAARLPWDLIDGLKNTLHARQRVKPMITQCAMRHLYETDNQQLISYVKANFEKRRCGHHELEKPLSTLECFQSVVDPKSSGHNKNCYIICSQDPKVRAKMRGVRGVPQIYIERSVMIMEPMADISRAEQEGLERGKLRAGLAKRSTHYGNKRKREDDGQEATQLPPEERKKRKIKGPKQPNPLSMKKKKKRPEAPATSSTVSAVQSEPAVT